MPVMRFPCGCIGIPYGTEQALADDRVATAAILLYVCETMSSSLSHGFTCEVTTGYGPRVYLRRGEERAVDLTDVELHQRGAELQGRIADGERLRTLRTIIGTSS